MNENPNKNIQELDDAELDNIVGGFSAGDRVVYTSYTKCPTCLASIPCATLQFYRGLDPNKQRAWIVKTGCCNTTFMCTENNIRRM